MRKYYYLLVVTLILFSFSTAFAQVEWPLENLNAINGATDHTIVGLPEVVPGIIGHAYKFDGLTAGIIVQDNPIDMAAEFTIEMYIKPEANPGVKAKMFNIWDADESANALFLECWGVDSTKTNDLPDKVILKTAFKTPLFNTATEFSAELETDKWYHIAWVADTTEYNFYINGVRSHGCVFENHYMYDNPEEYYQPFAGGHTAFGCRGGSNQKDFYKGMIDQIRVTQKVLTPFDFMPIPDEAVSYEMWGMEFPDMIEGANGDVMVLGVPMNCEGLVGNALECNGLTDAFLVDENPVANAEAFTLELYAYPKDTETKAKFINIWTAEEDTGAFLECWGTTPNKDPLPGYVHFKTHLTDGFYWHGKAFSDPLEVDHWYHVAMVVDAEKVELYIDGVLDTTAVYLEDPGYVEGREYYPFKHGFTSVGCRGGSNQKDFYTGHVDHLRFTKKALMPEDFLEPPDQLTAVRLDDGLSQVPETMNLSQNFPNPFNPTTTIQYELSEQNDVSLKIYNMLGREVRELVAKNQQPGNYRVTWDAHDCFGYPVSAGIYFYVFKAGNFTATKKMVLLK